MKILVVSGSFPPMPCGVGDYTGRLVAALAKIPGLSVSVIATGLAPDQPESVDGVQIIRGIADWKLRRFPQLMRLIRKQAPDLVHIQYPTRAYGNGLLPMLLPAVLALRGYKVVQTWHEEFRLRHLPEFCLKALVPSSLVVVRPNFRQNLPWVFQALLKNKTLCFVRNASVMARVEVSPEQRSQLRSIYLRGQQRLVVFFGFVLPSKGAELLFDIAEPSTDHVVIAGEISDGPSFEAVSSRQCEPAWAGRSTTTGFLPLEQLSMLLAVADAVVLPFRTGGGTWNSSIHGACAQGTFVLTTSTAGDGYDSARNIYFSRIDDVVEMRAALDAYSGTRSDNSVGADPWAQIAREHEEIYRILVNRVS